MRRHSSSQTEQPQLQSTNLDQATGRLVKHRQIVHLILSRPKLLQYPHILDQSPDGEDGDRESDRSRDQVGELGEWEVDGGVVQGVDECCSAC